MPSTVEYQLRRLMLLRVVVVTTLLLAATYVDVASGTLLAAHPLYFAIAATYAVTILYAVALRRLAGYERQAFIQVLGDLTLVTVLVYLTGGGGPRAGFALLYPLSVLSGSVILFRRRALVLAGCGTALYGTMLALARAGLLPPAGSDDIGQLPARHLLFSVFVTGLACGLVAWTGGFLAEGLRRADRQLEVAVGQVADLQRVNELIVDSLQSGLMIVGLDGLIRHANAFGAAILGAPARAMEGSALRTLFGSGFEPSSLRARTGRAEWSRREIRYRRSDGRELPLGVSLAPLAARAAQSEGYLLVFQDLTDVKRLEEKVRGSEKLAAVGEVAARLVHEIRNPLGAISGSAQVLIGDANMSEEQARLLDIIRRESQRLSESLNEFLTQTRAPLRPMIPVDLGPLLVDSVTLLRNSPEVGEHHRLVFEAPPGAHLCLGDPDRIAQVFWNLARNGLEAMPQGGTLTIELAASNGMLCLRLRDEGQGAPMSDSSARFLPSPGGLGLVIVYQIVREHHGDIAMHPASPRGNEVEVRLPALEGARSA